METRYKVVVEEVSQIKVEKDADIAELKSKLEADVRQLRTDSSAQRADLQLRNSRFARLRITQIQRTSGSWPAHEHTP